MVPELLSSNLCSLRSNVERWGWNAYLLHTLKLVPPPGKLCEKGNNAVNSLCRQLLPVGPYLVSSYFHFTRLKRSVVRDPWPFFVCVVVVFFHNPCRLSGILFYAHYSSAHLNCFLKFWRLRWRRKKVDFVADEPLYCWSAGMFWNFCHIYSTR